MSGRSFTLSRPFQHSRQVGHSNIHVWKVVQIFTSGSSFEHSHRVSHSNIEISGSSFKCSCRYDIPRVMSCILLKGCLQIFKQFLQSCAHALCAYSKLYICDETSTGTNGWANKFQIFHTCMFTNTFVCKISSISSSSYTFILKLLSMGVKLEYLDLSLAHYTDRGQANVECKYQ